MRVLKTHDGKTRWEVLGASDLGDGLAEVCRASDIASFDWKGKYPQHIKFPWEISPGIFIWK